VFTKVVLWSRDEQVHILGAITRGSLGPDRRGAHVETRIRLCWDLCDVDLDAYLSWLVASVLLVDVGGMSA
jgi:hypothetical protein